MINAACLIGSATPAIGLGGANATRYDQSGATKEFRYTGAPSGYALGQSKKLIYRDCLKPSVLSTTRQLYEIVQQSGTVIKFFTRLNSSNQFQIWSVKPGTNTVMLDLLATTTPLSSTSTWYTILCELDMDDFAKCAIYINDADQAITQTVFTTGEFFTVEAANSYTNYGSRRTGGGASSDRHFPGDRCETYVQFDEWLGIDTVAQRRKFNNASGLPTDLGPTGSLATGNQPRIYAPDGLTMVGSIGEIIWTTNGTPDAVAGPNP